MGVSLCHSFIIKIMTKFVCGQIKVLMKASRKKVYDKQLTKFFLQFLGKVLPYQQPTQWPSMNQTHLTSMDNICIPYIDYYILAKISCSRTDKARHIYCVSLWSTTANASDHCLSTNWRHVYCVYSGLWFGFVFDRPETRNRKIKDVQ